MSYNLHTIRQGFKDRGVYYTPPELAEMIKSYTKENPRKVYDPTCGDGALLAVFGDDVIKYGQELDGDQLNVARGKLTNFTGYHGDTLKDDGFRDLKFDCIVANPPFSIKWEPDDNDERFSIAPSVPTRSRADYAFILHTLHHLTDDGVAVVLNFPGVLYRGGREGVIRKWLVQRGVISKIVTIPPDTFVDTTISTVIMVMDKAHDGESITFEDKLKGISRKVHVSEIIENDYDLSVTRYIIDERPTVQINPTELEMAARKRMISKLRADIELSKLACDIEGYSYDDYLSDIEALLHEMRGLTPMICIMEYNTDGEFTGRLCRTDQATRETLSDTLSLYGVEVTVSESGWVTGPDPRVKHFAFRSALPHQPGTEVDLLELF